MDGEEERMSLELQVADACGRCGGSKCEALCIDCKIPFHHKCVSKTANWLSNEVVCDDCATNIARGTGGGGGDSLNKTIQNMQPAHYKAPSLSFLPGPMGINSTVTQGQFEDMQRRYAEMEKQLRRLTHGPHQPLSQSKNETAQSVVGDEGERQQPRRRHGDQRTDRSSRRSVYESDCDEEETWEHQVTRLNESFQLEGPVALTAQQRANRKSLAVELPKFNGDADQWVTFILGYSNSTRDCGFSLTENHKRLASALVGPALKLVEDKLRHPRHVPAVLRRLKKAFGQPDMLLSCMNAKIAKMDKLNEDLSNLVWFITKVEEVADVFTVIDESSRGSEQLKGLIKLVPLIYAAEWTRAKSVWGGDVQGLAKYLDNLCDFAIECGRTVTVTKSRAVSAPLVKERQVTNHHRMMIVAEASADECPMNCRAVHALEDCSLFNDATTWDRWSVVKKFRRCNVCLGPHFKRDCTNRVACGVNDCRGPHHRLLHFKNQPAGQQRAPVIATSPSSCVQRSLVVNTNRKDTNKKNTHLRVLPVLVTNGNRTVRTFALLDSGSGITAMTTSLARRLGLTGKKGRLALQWTNSKTTHFADSERVEFHLGKLDGTRQFAIAADTMDDLDLPLASVPARLLHEEELNVGIDSFEMCQPELLVGQDYASMTRTIRSVIGLSGKVIASETALGWVVEGVSPKKPQTNRLMFCNAHRIESPMKTLVERVNEAGNGGPAGQRVVGVAAGKLVEEKAGRARAEKNSQEKERPMLFVDNRQMQQRVQKLEGEYQQESEKAQSHLDQRSTMKNSVLSERSLQDLEIVHLKDKEAQLIKEVSQLRDMKYKFEENMVKLKNTHILQLKKAQEQIKSEQYFSQLYKKQASDLREEVKEKLRVIAELGVERNLEQSLMHQVQIALTRAVRPKPFDCRGDGGRPGEEEYYAEVRVKGPTGQAPQRDVDVTGREVRHELGVEQAPRRGGPGHAQTAGRVGAGQGGPGRVRAAAAEAQDGGTAQAEGGQQVGEDHEPQGPVAGVRQECQEEDAGLGGRLKYARQGDPAGAAKDAAGAGQVQRAAEFAGRGGQSAHKGELAAAGGGGRRGRERVHRVRGTRVREVCPKQIGQFSVHRPPTNVARFDIGRPRIM